MSRRITALLALGLALTANTASAYRAFVVESDFATGSFGTVNTNTRAQACDLVSPHSDARVRARGNRAYIVNRFGADNITVFDATTQTVVRQFSVGNGANPYDLEFASATGSKAYVTRYETADLWAVDVNLGTHTGTVSLAAFAGADGIPEMDHMARVGNRLFVSLQRLDRAAGYIPTDTSLVVVVDVVADTVVDCDRTRPGRQGIRLPFANPVTPFAWDAARQRFYLGCAGSYGAPDGGIVAIDPATYATTVVATEDSLGGDVLDLACSDDARSFAIVSDASFNTSLIRWSPVTGRRTATLYAPGGFSLADAEVTPGGEEVWVCNSSFSSPGLLTFNATTGLPVGSPIVCSLPPQGIAFDASITLIGGVPASESGLAFAAPVPNPARTGVSLRLATGGGEVQRAIVLDVAGRRVRTLPTPATGTMLAQWDWDLRDDAGARVPPGLYLVSVRTALGSVSRSVLVVP